MIGQLYEWRIAQSEPYFQRSDDAYQRLQICDGDRVIAEVLFGKPSPENYEEGWAQAHLFKAAPELLDACKAAFRGDADYFQKCREAILKAEGK